MILVNEAGSDTTKKRYVNGSIDYVKATKTDDKNALTEVIVEVNGYKVHIRKHKWAITEYAYNKDKKVLEKRVLATINQFPLRLAWAITIHKSQGLTFNEANIDIGNGTFASGQTYTAFSRLRSFEGLYVKNKISPQDIQISEKIIDFEKTLYPKN